VDIPKNEQLKISPTSHSSERSPVQVPREATSISGGVAEFYHWEKKTTAPCQISLCCELTSGSFSK